MIPFLDRIKQAMPPQSDDDVVNKKYVDDAVANIDIPEGGDIAISNVTGLQTALDSKAPLESPNLTGTPTVPTAAAGTNTTQAASTKFVNDVVASKITYGTTELTPGTSSLDTGSLYLQYE